MAITYTGAGGLFTRLGRIAFWSNSLLTYQSTTLLGSNGLADDILDEYEDRRDLATGVQADAQGFASSAAGWIGRLKTYADNTLSDLQPDLDAPNNAVSTILPLLVLDMVANSQTVDASTVGTPSVSAGGSNVGNGQLVVSKKNVAAADDERIIAETVKAVCLSSSYDGGTSGGEAFSITGFPSYGPNDYHARGNGSGPTIQVADASANLLTNGNFTTFTVADTPDSWTIDNGIVTTNIAQETSNVHRGGSALKLKGDGATATIKLHQAWNTNAKASTIYAVGVWLRKSGTVGAGSTLAITIKGTGFSTQTLYSADPNGLTTSFAFSSLFFPIGTTFPSDLKLEIAWTAANTAGATAVILIDDIVLQRPTDFGHAQYALFAGATDFATGDVFTVTTTNGYQGTFQTWFNRYYDTALPSDAVGGETILDSLAE